MIFHLCVHYCCTKLLYPETVKDPRGTGGGLQRRGEEGLYWVLIDDRTESTSSDRTRKNITMVKTPVRICLLRTNGQKLDTYLLYVRVRKRRPTEQDEL